MNLAPADLASAHRWERVTFTTYALRLSFFEAVVLDALIRGGARQALILADIQGVRASLSEQGAQRVGKDYNVEPVLPTQSRSHIQRLLQELKGEGKVRGVGIRALVSGNRRPFILKIGNGGKENQSNGSTSFVFKHFYASLVLANLEVAD